MATVNVVEVKHVCDFCDADIPKGCHVSVRKTVVVVSQSDGSAFEVEQHLADCCVACGDRMLASARNEKARG